MNMEKKSLLQQLTWTILGLCTALIALWFLFYIYMNFAIKSYTMHNMEQVSSSVITELEQTFLELEDISFAVSENDAIYDFLTTKDRILVHTKAGQVKLELDKIVDRNILADNLLLYNSQGEFYRFYGNISNTAAKRIYYTIEKETEKNQIQISVEGINYIGYVALINHNEENLGQIVLLIDENDIYRLFFEAGGLKDMTIGLAANNIIIVANDDKIIGSKVGVLKESTKYLLHKAVGFTPFELIIVYENANRNVIVLFLAAIIVTAFLLWVIIHLFLRFWKNKFFQPIQEIIQEVEKFEGGKGEVLKEIEIEYFDSLVNGINNMLNRIEEKDAELYNAAFSLQEAEIKKQKALVISLKKQINAHFTVNVLNIIKALSYEGESEKAGLMCDGLSFLLRYANGGETLVNAMEEFFILNKYLVVMEVRYPGRFKAEVEIEDFLEEIKLPRMLLQPLVENSILHGFKDMNCCNESTTQNETLLPQAKGMIHIYCVERQQDLQFIVEDNGCGMENQQVIQLQKEIDYVQDEDEIEVEGLSHVALINIQRRIMSYFGKGYGVTIESKKREGTRVILTLPKT